MKPNMKHPTKPNAEPSPVPHYGASGLWASEQRKLMAHDSFVACRISEFSV